MNLPEPAGQGLDRSQQLRQVAAHIIHLEGILNNLEPLCIVNEAKQVTHINTSMADFLGRDYHTCIGVNLVDIFSNWDIEVILHHVDAVVASRRPSLIGDFPLPEHGKKGWFQINFYPLAQSKGHNECIISLHNTTELFLTKKILLEQYKKLEEQQTNLEQKNALLIETRRILDQKHEAIMEELSVAQDVQQGLLPTTLPQIPGLKFHSTYDPISQVGGDLYDVIDLGNRKIGIFIGDVSGHGLPAAFVGAMVKMTLVDNAYDTISPKALFEKMNHSLIQHLKSGHYLTAFYGVLDLHTYDFTYCKASHPQPLLIHSDGTLEKLDSPGLFLGLMNEPGYEERTVRLRKGDRLFLFTDGYFEIKGDTGVEFLYDVLVEFLRNSQSLALSDVSNQLTREIIRKMGNVTPEDDRTFLAMEISEDSMQERHPILEHFTAQERVHIRIFASEEEFDILFLELETFLSQHSVPEDKRKQISIAALELANNSMEHAHHRDLRKKIQIAYAIHAGFFKLTILDEGKGFDWSNLPDPRIESNWQKERGRGIFIVKSYMDDVIFNAKGNMVTLLKNIHKTQP